MNLAPILIVYSLIRLKGRFGMSHSYRQQRSEQTLSEGLQEYYGSRSDLVAGRGVSEDAREFFRCHDTVHVVFGCGTSLPEEACVKMWSFFGTDAGFSKLLAGYKLPESNEIYEKLSPGQIVTAAWASCWIVPTVLIRSRRLARRWPWDTFEDYGEAKLSEIRTEFGIEVIPISTD